MNQMVEATKVKTANTDTFKVDAFKLKVFALIFMLLDHIHSYLGYTTHEYLNWPEWPIWISAITRFVSPLFLYLMIDGFYHTRSRKKFLIRLFVAGIIMWTGNMIINYSFHNVNEYTGKYTFRSLVSGNNIFLTLAFLFAFVWCLENIRQRKKIVLSIIFAIITSFMSCLMEGGIYLLPVAIVVWFFHGKKKLQCIGIALWCMVLLIAYCYNNLSGNTGSASLFSYLCFRCEWAIASVIPFILMYNGERGINNKFTKYMFYIIYPLHLWLLMIIQYLIIK